MINVFCFVEMLGKKRQRRRGKANEDVSRVGISFPPVSHTLGEGSYACAFLSRDGTKVIRFAESQKEDDGVDTALTTAKLQQRLYNAVESPFVPIVYEVAEYRGAIPKAYLRALEHSDSTCNDFYAKYGNGEDYDFVVTIMEYGTLGSLNQPGLQLTKQNIFGIGFCLFWQCCVNLVKYGFQHRDIKPANIVLKRGFESYRFNDRWTITGMTHVPMLIDYDLSEFSTERHNRFPTYATTWWAPPEVLISRQYAEYQIGTIDIWSIGIMMFYLQYGNVTRNIAEEEAKLFANEVIPRYGLDKEDKYRIAFFTEIYVLLMSLHNNDPKILLVSFAGEVPPSIVHLLNVILHKQREKYDAIFRNMPPAELAFYRRVLHFVPHNRAFGGQMAQILEMEVFRNTVAPSELCMDVSFLAVFVNIWLGKTPNQMFGGSIKYMAKHLIDHRDGHFIETLAKALKEGTYTGTDYPGLAGALKEEGEEVEDLSVSLQQYIKGRITREELLNKLE